MQEISLEKKLYNILRIGTAMCFIGHGAFGIITKAVWCNYFAVFGIGHDLAYRLMPLLGSIDIFFGIIVLLYPVRAIPAWLVAWGLVTASLRPLSGEPFGELIERAGNSGAPLVLLLLVGFNRKSPKSWFTHISPDILADKKTIEKMTIALRVIVCLLLAGHGWLNLIQKKALIAQYSSLHIQNPLLTASFLGWFEAGAALFILIKPVRSFIFFIFLWKMISELFYPHYELFEWVERGGSYTCLLALWMLSKKSQTMPLQFNSLSAAT